MTLTTERRISAWVRKLNLTIRTLDQRPDQPMGNTVYLVKDIFTTRFGSWELSDELAAIVPWARAAYLTPYFLEAGADHHLFAAVLGLDGQLVKDLDTIFWSDGFDKLADASYQGFVHVKTKESSGWANLFMASGSSFVPERGEAGPWCWCPVGASEVVCGGGLPSNQHISTFVVWQAVNVELKGGTENAVNIAAMCTAAWQGLGVHALGDSALAEYARQNNLGAPQMAGFELNGYLVQGFAGGIVYAPTIDLAPIQHTGW